MKRFYCNRVTLRALCPLSLYEDSRRIWGTRATCRWGDRSCAAAKQGWLLPASTRSCEEARKDSTQNLRGSTALPTPRFRLTASRTENNFLCFKATQFERLSYGSSRKEVHLDTQQKYVNTYKKRIEGNTSLSTWRKKLTHRTAEITKSQAGGGAGG